MKLSSLLKDVSVQQVGSPCQIASPLFSNDFMKVNQCEASIEVEGVGQFYVRDGKAVHYSPSRNADPLWLNWCLNSHVLVALLHQRRIVNFHASSVIFKEMGIMILGRSGAGKSSLIAAFSMDGAGFLSDDVTPILFNEEIPYIWPVYQQIRLREGALHQLNVDTERLIKAEKGTEKYFLPGRKAPMSSHPLHLILQLEVREGEEGVQFHELTSHHKFTLLRSEICSWEMLRGMPETEKAYLQQLIEIVRQVPMIRVTRSSDVPIPVMHKAITRYLSDF